MLMWAAQLQLNEIIDWNNPFVVRNNAIEKALYDTILQAYRNSYVNDDNLDSFKASFGFYWNKNIGKYTSLLNTSKDFYSNYFQFRSGKSVHNSDKNTTRKQTKTEEFTPTEIVTTKYDHTMQQDYKTNTEDGASNKIVEKRFEQNAIETETAANTSTMYTYSSGETGDTTSRSGKNTTTTKWTGDPDTEHNDLTITDNLSDFDPERFEKALRSTNVYDLWIDEFSPLFSGVLFYD